jgi:predicted ATPase
MPWLVDAAEFEAFQRAALGTSRERMLREMVEAVEALTAEAPLILAFEDLHWCDPSTLDLIALLARRREPARLLLIGTYRPADAKTSCHPLHAVTQELCSRGRAEELALKFLDEGAVGAYLAAHFPNAALPAGLVRLLHERTDGNPLFMENVVASWIDQGLLVEMAGAGRCARGSTSWPRVCQGLCAS